jgi:hypothetical protein
MAMVKSVRCMQDVHVHFMNLMVFIVLEKRLVASFHYLPPLVGHSSQQQDLLGN